MKAWEDLPGGIDTPDYAQLVAEKESIQSSKYAMQRNRTDAYHAQNLAGVNLRGSIRAGQLQHIELKGTSDDVAASKSILLTGLKDQLSEARNQLAMMKQGGYTSAEITQQQTAVNDIKNKIGRVDTDVAGAALSRWQSERGVMSSKQVTTQQHQIAFGSLDDITSAYKGVRTTDAATLAGLSARRSGVDIETQMKIDMQMEEMKRKMEQDSINERSLYISRRDDRYSLIGQNATNVVNESIRKGGINRVRGGYGGIIAGIDSEIGEVKNDLNQGGLTHDQEQALKMKLIQLQGRRQDTAWNSLEQGINMRYSIAGNQVRGSGLAMLNAIGTAGQEYARAGVDADSPIWSELNTKRRNAQMTAFHQADTLSYDIPMLRMNAQEQIHQNMPFSPGYGLALSMQRMQFRAPYIKERIARYNYLISKGDISEDEQAQQAQEILGLQVQQSAEIGKLASGGPGRIAAMSSGALSYRGRFDSISLAQTALAGSGHPRRDLGFANGAHLAGSDRWFDSFRTDAFNPMVASQPWSKSGDMNTSILKQILDAIKGNNSSIGAPRGSFPGEDKGRINDNLDQGTVSVRTNYLSRY